MRDFFTGLAARSFGAETGVRPRLTSIFEPAPSLAVPAGFSASDREAERESPAAVDEGLRRRVSRGPSAEPLAPAQAPRSLREPERYGPRGPIEERSKGIGIELVSPKKTLDEHQSPHDALRPASTQNLALESNGDASMAGTENSAKARALTPPSLGAEEVKIGSVLSHPVDAPHSPHDNRELASAQAQNGSPAGHVASLYSSHAIADLAARMRDTALALNATAPSRKNDRDSDREAAGVAEPIIHVTIGRVEVRATADVPREKRPRPASLVMGLDEYLRRTAQRTGK